jgi:hypothetical protein
MNIDQVTLADFALRDDVKAFFIRLVTPDRCQQLYYLSDSIEKVLSNEGTCFAAAVEGNLELLKWLRRSELPCADGSLIDGKTQSDQESEAIPAIVCPWSSSTLAGAAIYGHLSLIKWMTDETIHGTDACQYDNGVCHAAITGGHLELLKWICSKFPHRLDRWICGAAAIYGHLHILQWLRDPDAHGTDGSTPWHQLVIAAAVSNHYWKVASWCYENGCPYYQRDLVYIRRATP